MLVMNDGNQRGYWVRTLSRFVGTQGLVQLLGFLIGVAVVRTLDKESYAQYAVITSMVAAMTLISESGVRSGLLSRGAPLLSRSDALSSLFASALRFRRVVAVAVIVVGDSVLLVLVLRTGAEPIFAAAYLLLVAVTFFPILTKGVLQPYFQLTKQFQALQNVALASSLLRLLGVAVLVGLGSISITGLLTIGLVCAFFEVWQLRRRSKPTLSFNAARDVEATKLFGQNLRKTLPMNLVLVLQGQVLYLFLGFSGQSDVLAEIAALSRFAIVFVILNSIVSDIGSGVVARAHGNRRRVSKTMFSFIGGFAVAAIFAVALAWVFAKPLLWILGPNYQGIELALVIVAGGTAAINLADTMRVLNQARGWLTGSWTYIPLTICWAATGLLLFDLRNINEAAVFMGLQAVPGLFAQTVCFISGYKSHRDHD